MHAKNKPFYGTKPTRLYGLQPFCGWYKRITANAKRQSNTKMTEQKQTYERIIKRVTDQLVKWTIGQEILNEKPSPHFLFIITPDAHLAHCQRN